MCVHNNVTLQRKYFGLNLFFILIMISFIQICAVSTTHIHTNMMQEYVYVSNCKMNNTDSKHFFLLRDENMKGNNYVTHSFKCKKKKK